ncbi:MmcQ/YjbR family DNA-binding protein [Enterococcus xiangfangensis]|uniref:MmcQ/YjbR family DNA-binding protein n=1 Tax=Enterococcus xiangfangensis TaxID=1296537 RepID=UPI003D17CD94|nr:MmcQ/YjbR family DNA-binding protein [Enterococcus asini]
MKRKEIFQYVAEKYNTKPEYLWKKYPHYAVLRYQQNKKWYAIIMDVEKENLGLEGEKSEDIMDIKLNPETIELLQSSKGFLPAYHMNKSHCLSVRIDQMDSKQIGKLIDASYELTES